MRCMLDRALYAASNLHRCAALGLAARHNGRCADKSAAHKWKRGRQSRAFSGRLPWQYGLVSDFPCRRSVRDQARTRLGAETNVQVHHRVIHMQRAAILSKLGPCGAVQQARRVPDTCVADNSATRSNDAAPQQLHACAREAVGRELDGVHRCAQDEVAAQSLEPAHEGLHDRAASALHVCARESRARIVLHRAAQASQHQHGRRPSPWQYTERILLHQYACHCPCQTQTYLPLL